jgi:hypothetical protein
VKADAAITEWTQHVTHVWTEITAERVNGCLAFMVRVRIRVVVS